MLTHQEATASDEYQPGRVEYLRTTTEISNEEGQVRQTKIDGTDHAVVVKQGRTVRIPMSRVVRVRIEH